jgi:hypothetical protein
MLRIAVVFGVLVIFLGGPMSRAAAQVPDGGYLFKPPPVVILKQLAQHVNFEGFDDSKLTFLDAIDFFQKKYGLWFAINEKAFRLDNIKHVLQERIALKPIPAMRDAPLRDVVLAVLKRVSPRATYICRVDGIEITTHREALKNAREESNFWVGEIMKRTQFVRGLPTDVNEINILHDDWLQMARGLGTLFYWNQILSNHAKALVSDG